MSSRSSSASSSSTPTPVKPNAEQEGNGFPFNFDRLLLIRLLIAFAVGFVVASFLIFIACLPSNELHTYFLPFDLFKKTANKVLCYVLTIVIAVVPTFLYFRNRN